MRCSPIPGAMGRGFGLAQGWLLCCFDRMGCEIVVSFLLLKLQAGTLS